jgi:deoxyinosine 3'endonuclease (endonuclease V)
MFTKRELTAVVFDYVITTLFFRYTDISVTFSSMNEHVLHTHSQGRLHKLKRGEAKWVGHILRGNGPIGAKRK